MKRIGYVAIALGLDVNTNRTCRLKNATPDRLRELIESNLDGLKKTIQYNIENKILMYRISSQIIPFASHDINKIEWWNEYETQLSEIGSLIKKSEMRVSMHPPHFVNLSSPSESVIDGSIKDLKWHSTLLDSLGVDSTHKLIIHVGGAYGDKFEAMNRFIDRFKELPKKIRDRLIIENDERIYTVEDCCNISKSVDVPVVFDYLHHDINPGPHEDYIDALKISLSTWKGGDGKPKIHFSTQEKNARLGTHSKSIDVDEFSKFYKRTENLDFDIMLEVKDKNLSLFKIRDVLDKI